MKKKLLLSSILTPIIPITTLVSCGSGVINLDQIIPIGRISFNAWSKTVRYTLEEVSKLRQYDLYFAFNVLEPVRLEQETYYILIELITFKDGQLDETDPMPFYDATSKVNSVVYNNQTLERGKADSDKDCWYLEGSAESSHKSLYIKISNFDKNSTLSMSFTTSCAASSKNEEFTFTPSMFFAINSSII